MSHLHLRITQVQIDHWVLWLVSTGQTSRTQPGKTYHRLIGFAFTSQAGTLWKSGLKHSRKNLYTVKTVVPPWGDFNIIINNHLLRLFYKAIVSSWNHHTCIIIICSCSFHSATAFCCSPPPFCLVLFILSISLSCFLTTCNPLLYILPLFSYIHHLSWLSLYFCDSLTHAYIYRYIKYQKAFYLKSSYKWKHGHLSLCVLLIILNIMIFPLNW